ncbi:F0F1 ATP synthase subunit B [Bacillaceae bacterium]
MFSIEWGTMLYQLVLFIILFLLLRKYAFGPLMGVMQKRQEYVESQLAAAEKNRAEAEALLEEQRNVLQQARQEAQQIVERAKKQSEAEAEKILASAQQHAERMIEEARAEIEREKEKAVAELRDQVAGLSVLLASKIIEKELNEKEQAQEIEQFLKQVGDRL